MEKKSVYIETSVISYLTARPSNNLMVAAWQAATVDWWGGRRGDFVAYVSNVVLREAGEGNPEAAARRLDALHDFPLLPLTEDVKSLVARLMLEGALPQKAADDAFHVAVAAVNGMDYLLTWNCRHIDNAETKPLMRKVCADSGFVCPEICTPQELMGIDYDEG